MFLLNKIKKIFKLIVLNLCIISLNYAAVIVTPPNEILSFVDQALKKSTETLNTQITELQKQITQKTQDKETWEETIAKTKLFIEKAPKAIGQEQNSEQKRKLTKKLSFYQTNLPIFEEKKQALKTEIDPLQNSEKNLAEKLEENILFSKFNNNLKITNYVILGNDALYPQKTFLDKACLQQIPIFINLENLQNSLFSKIDLTNTNTGALMLVTNLANPISNKEDFEKNKVIIKALLNNEKLYKDLDQLLKEFKTLEDQYLENYLKVLQIPEDKIDELIQKQLGTLEQTKWTGFCNAVKNKFVGIKNLFSFSKDPILKTINLFFHSIFYYGMVQAYLHPSAELSINYKSPTFWGTLLLRFFAENPMYSMFFMLTTGIPANDFFSLGLPLLVGGYSIKEVGGVLKETLWDNPNNMAKVKAQIESINENIIKVFTNISNIHNTIKASPELKTLTTFLENFISEQKTLINQLLETMGNAEKSDKEKSKEIYKLIMENLIKKSKQDTSTNSFNLALKTIGQIDYYLSLAKLIKEKNYCLADFSENKKINIAFENLTNPIDKTQKTFSTKIDATTTNFKTQEELIAVTNAIILSHLGVAPATKATICPISYMHISLPHGMLVINN